MAKRKKPKKQRLAADRPSVDRVTNREFLEKNLILSPAIQQSINRGETTRDMLKGQLWLSPLDILEVYANDRRTPAQLRIEAAKAAAPYKHKKMPHAVELSGDVTIRQTFADAVGAASKTPESSS